MELIDDKYVINYMNSVKQDLLFGMKIDWLDTAKTLAVMRNEEEYDIEKTKFIIAYSIKLDAYGKESLSQDENSRYKAEVRCAEKYGLTPEEVSKRLDVANKVMRKEEERGVGFGDREYYETFKEVGKKFGIEDNSLDMILFDQPEVTPQITGTNKDTEYNGSRKELLPILDVPEEKPQISGTNKDMGDSPLGPTLDGSFFYDDDDKTLDNNELIDDNDIPDWSADDMQSLDDGCWLE